MRAIRAALVGVVAPAAFAVAAIAGAVPAEASCVPPEFSVTPGSAAPGQRVVAHGKAWIAICNDVNPTGPTPPDGANIFFVQNGRSVQVTYVKARADLTFDAPFAVPEWAVPGEATVRGVGRSSTGEAPLIVTRGALPRTGGGNSTGLLAVCLLLAAGVAARLRMLARR